MDSECDCVDCINNIYGECELSWITLDLNGVCTDIELRKDN